MDRACLWIQQCWELGSVSTIPRLVVLSSPCSCQISKLDEITTCFPRNSMTWWTLLEPLASAASAEVIRLTVELGFKFNPQPYQVVETPVLSKDLKGCRAAGLVGLVLSTSMTWCTSPTCWPWIHSSSSFLPLLQRLVESLVASRRWCLRCGLVFHWSKGLGSTFWSRGLGSVET